jgi:hypothetical protein
MMKSGGRRPAEEESGAVPFGCSASPDRMVELFFTKKIRLFPEKSIQTTKKSEKNTFAA